MSDADPTRQIEMLVRIAQLLATLDLDEVLLKIIQLTTDTVGAARGSFFLLDEQGNAVQRFIAARNLDPKMKPEVSNRVLGAGLAGWVLANKQAAIVDDTLSDGRWIRLDDDTEHGRVRSAICVPFFVDGQIRGIVTLEHPQPKHFGQEDLRLVQASANQAAAAIRNAQLFDRVQTQQRQLEAVLNSISEALIVADGEWRVRIVNPAALLLIGATQQADVLDQPLDAIAERFGKPVLARLKEDAALAHQGGAFEVRDDTTSRDYAVQISRSETTAGGYVIALHDVTSLKDLNRLKTHMLQMASHDLKNPIGVLRGYLDVIRGDAKNGVPPEPGFLENMYKAIARMETLVSNLLDIQRAEHSSPLRRDLIDPYELIQAVIDDITPGVQARRHTLIQNIQSGLRPLKGDFTRLREAMDNLIENAIKYTPEGGQITISLFTEDERFNFNVKDTGLGIPADQQSRVFQPYFRARQAGMENIAGTGLGLSLVKEVIERHGGQIWFTSAENQGSTFGFWLPLLA